MPKLTRLLAVLTVLAAAASGRAQACTCAGTRGIGTALTEAEVVVVARVQRQVSGISGNIEPTAETVLVSVTKTLKGKAAAEISVSSPLMCYRSFDTRDLEPGQSYVLPLTYDASRQLYLLPTCSESALLLKDNMLYGREWDPGDARAHLEPYMSLGMMEFLLPLHVLHTGILLAAAAVLSVLVLTTLPFLLRKPLPLDPARALKSLTLRSRMAIGLLAACAAAMLSLAFMRTDLSAGFGGATLLLLAAGIALRWRWVEGFTYSLALIGTVMLCYVLYTGVRLELHPYPGYRHAPMAVITLLAMIAITLWLADAVRRRYSAR